MTLDVGEPLNTKNNQINLDILSIENSVDPGQLVSEESN